MLLAQWTEGLHYFLLLCYNVLCKGEFDGPLTVFVFVSAGTVSTLLEILCHCGAHRIRDWSLRQSCKFDGYAVWQFSTIGSILIYQTVGLICVCFFHYFLIGSHHATITSLFLVSVKDV